MAALMVQPLLLVEVNMPNGIPPGYTARLLGSATTLDGLYSYVPLEEGLAEGSLMLMELQFGEFLANETLQDINQALLNAGVPPWPGNSYIVFADATQPIIHLAWIKGIAWMGIIIGILVLTVLPVLLGAFVWWVLPEEVTALIVMMVVMLMMFLMLKMITPMLTEGKKE